MKNTISKKQKTIIWVSVALVLAASGLSNILETQHSGSYGNQPVSRNWQAPSNDSRNWQTNDSGNTGQQPVLENNMPPYSGNMPNINADDVRTSNNMPTSNNPYIADQGTMTAGGSSDMGSGAITGGYWNRQASQDGVYRDIDNQILDQTTVRNDATGETFQTQSGGDSYVQSPSVEGAMGGSGIVGVGAGETAPSDSTPLTVVTGGDSSPSATSTSESP